MSSVPITPPGLAAVAASPDAEPRGPTFAEVYAAHWDFVWRALRALGVREADLEDQTHEVFVVVHRRLADFEGRAKLSTWLWSIASRVASEWRRRPYVRREQPTENPPEPDGFAPAPDVAYERQQARSLVDRVLATMPDEQRVVFALYELDGLAVDDIAALAGCPVNTVYSRLRLARKHFEKTLDRLQARGGR